MGKEFRGGLQTGYMQRTMGEREVNCGALQWSAQCGFSYTVYERDCEIC